MKLAFSVSSMRPALIWFSLMSLFYRNEEADWLVMDLHDPLGLYDSAAGRVHPLLQEVVPGPKHACGHGLFDYLLGSVPVRHRGECFPTLDEAAQFVNDLLDRVVWQLHPRHCMVS